VGSHAWAVQIGAFANTTAAQSQLAAYANRSIDVLGHAHRIVMPVHATDGQTLYRARFGPYAERDARAVCAKLTHRGQTCFATTAAH
jgi:D-alanyl-D-alanine carboxypeptidase